MAGRWVAAGMMLRVSAAPQAARKGHGDRMMAAAPLKPMAGPKKFRKLLIFTLVKGVKLLREKIRAWTSVISGDPRGVQAPEPGCR